MDVSSACCCIIYDSLFWRCQPRVRVINIDQVFSKKGARKEDGGREISLTWCQFCVKLRGGSKRRKSCCLNSIWFMSIDEIYNTVIVQQTIVHNTRKVLEANDAVNSMRCQVLYFIKTCREKKKKGNKQQPSETRCWRRPYASLLADLFMAAASYNISTCIFTRRIRHIQTVIQVMPLTLNRWFRITKRWIESKCFAGIPTRKEEELRYNRLGLSRNWKSIAAAGEVTS
jgi:hypothetical protein